MKRDFKGVFIPAKLWLDSTIPALEKNILVEIHSLDNKEGCYASNKHFSEMFGVSERRIRQIIQSLKDRGFVSLELIYKGDSKEVDKRLLRCVYNFNNPEEKYCHPEEENFRDPRKNFSSGGGEKYCHYSINTLKSIKQDSIEKQFSNKEKYKKENFADRLESFKTSIWHRQKDYPKEMVEAFIEYWTEANENDIKFRAEKEKIFDIEKRLARWARNSKSFNKAKIELQARKTPAEMEIERLRHLSPIKSLTDDQLIRYASDAKVCAYPFPKYIEKLVNEGKIKNT